MNEKVSVLILTQNSQEYIKRCLDSLIRFDEVVIVDGGSTDETLTMAEKYSNVVIHENPWPGFIEQRNVSIDKATHSWCFMIDSDEAATPELVNEIYEIVNNDPQKVLYNVCRTEYFLGEEVSLGHGKSWWQERLFIRDRVRYIGGTHHEHLIDGKPVGEQQDKIGYLNYDHRVLHDPMYGLEDWIRKLPRFSVLIGNEKYAAGKRVEKSEILLTLFFTFFQIYKKSWRLGKLGFVIALQTVIYRTLMKLVIYEKTHFGFDRSEKAKSLG